MTQRLPSPFVLKAWLGGAGLVVGLAAIVLNWRWLIWVAVGLLALAFLARFLDGHRS